MIKLKKIKKEYKQNDVSCKALKGIDIEFRKSEFVSILGPSGCGKTTTLNILGGLDRYTSGDLIINGKSTKEFKDKDWDNYRNHSVGFVFQSYNLIPHQSVLQNVELALTLSGVSKKERKERATEALKKVGLGDKLKNKPSQLSGGQMQRVAIARALVNDPEIVLADEPTGALDTESSLQIMELLKEISKDKLIVMVTHNPELAEKYSTRIVKLLDGEIVSDSMPYNSSKEKEEKPEPKQDKKKTKMSFFTALSLSFKNLLTKKARTILVAFAGSIGIIGIALILAISSGFSNYVTKMQEDTLSSYPVEINNSNYDMSALMKIFFNDGKETSTNPNDKVYTKNELTDMLAQFNMSSQSNDLKSLKTYIDANQDKVSEFASAVQYVYGFDVNAYFQNSINNNGNPFIVNPTTVFSDVISNYALTHTLENGSDKKIRFDLLTYMFGSTSSYYSNVFWSEMIDNKTLLQSQYDVVAGNWTNSATEVMIVLDKNNQISDYTLFGLGLLDQSKLNNLLDEYINNTAEVTTTSTTFEYNDLLNLEYKIIPESFYFDKQVDNTYIDIRDYKATNPTLYEQKISDLYNNHSISVSVAGIIKEKPEASNNSINSVIAYNSSLTQLIIDTNNSSEVVTAQLQTTSTNVLTNQNFEDNKTQKDVLAKLGYVDMSSPEKIYIYPVDFEAKEDISSFIDEYNSLCLSTGEDNKVITYSDTIGTMMSSITLIISAISYVLIAFVSVSLVVSSIMIGIITYISVIERKKEIGVLRSIGASKRDVKRVFTAESFIIGLTSGLLGIIVTLLFIIPINIILKNLTDIASIAFLPATSAIILILISVALTFIAGLIPAKIAAKKDPVIALREI